jgi:hypothetical protein
VPSDNVHGPVDVAIPTSEPSNRLGPSSRGGHDNNPRSCSHSGSTSCELTTYTRGVALIQSIGDWCGPDCKRSSVGPPAPD